MGGRLLAWGGELGPSTSPRPAVLMPVDMYTVTLALLALQREDGVGAPRRRGGDRRVVDVRRPSTNASRSKAGAVFWRSPPTDEPGAASSSRSMTASGRVNAITGTIQN